MEKGKVRHLEIGFDAEMISFEINTAIEFQSVRLTLKK